MGIEGRGWGSKSESRDWSMPRVTGGVGDWDDISWLKGSVGELIRGEGEG